MGMSSSHGTTRATDRKRCDHDVNAMRADLSKFYAEAPNLFNESVRQRRCRCDQPTRRFRWAGNAIDARRDGADLPRTGICPYSRRLPRLRLGDRLEAFPGSWHDEIT